MQEELEHLQQILQKFSEMENESQQSLKKYCIKLQHILHFGDYIIVLLIYFMHLIKYYFSFLNISFQCFLLVEYNNKIHFSLMVIIFGEFSIFGEIYTLSLTFPILENLLE